MLSKTKYLAICLVLFIGCKTARLPSESIKERVETVITEKILHDTIPLEADTTAWLQALYECDSLGNVLVSKLQEQIGRRSHVENSATPVAKKLLVTSRCVCDSLSIYAEFKTRDTSTIKTTEIGTPYAVEVEKKLTWWQKIKIAYGGYALGAWGLVLLWFVGRIALKIFSLTPYGAALNGGGTILKLILKLFRL